MGKKTWKDEFIDRTWGKCEAEEDYKKAGFEAVIGYIRVSTEGQTGEDKYGIEMQKSAIHDYCITKRMYVKEWYVDVVSGVEEKREALNYLMYSYDSHTMKKVVAFKSDRIARETKLYFYILYMLERRGLKLECVTEEFESEGEFANLYRSMLMFCAEQERKNIQLRTSRGKEIKKREGGYIGGNLAYGYGTAGHELRVNRREAYIVQFVFYSYYEKKMTMTKIKDLLNNKRVPTKRGGTWHTSTIKRILENKRFYQGFVTDTEGNEIVGKHTPILRVADPDDYSRLVVGLEKNADFHEFDEHRVPKREPGSVVRVKAVREFGENSDQKSIRNEKYYERKRMNEQRNS